MSGWCLLVSIHLDLANAPAKHTYSVSINDLQVRTDRLIASDLTSGGERQPQTSCKVKIFHGSYRCGTLLQPVRILFMFANLCLRCRDPFVDNYSNTIRWSYVYHTIHKSKVDSQDPSHRFMHSKRTGP
jgi:hypothetical protein